MALTHRAVTSAGNGSSNQRTITKPAGTASGDHLRLLFYIEATGQTLAGLTGLTQNATSPSTNAGSTPDFVTYVYERIADGTEPASWVITWDGNFYWNTATITADSGGDTGTQNDVAASVNEDETGINGSPTGLSITTVTNDALLQWLVTDFNGAGTTGPAGFTERVDFGTNGMYDQTQAAAGASGNKVGTVVATYWTVFLAASRPAAAGGASTVPVKLGAFRRRRQF